mgnify:CR=1 FL=1
MKRSKKFFTRFIQSILRNLFFKSLYPSYLFFKTKRKFKKIINKNKDFKKYSNNLDKINDYEYKLTSQNNEDGIIEHVFKNIPNNKYFIEIGFGYYEFNSLNLIKNNWSGKLIDIDQDEVIALKKNLDFFFPKNSVEIINAKITKDNITSILSDNKNKVIDFFSLDIDSNDYWILKEIDLSNISLLCCEYNHWLGKDKKLTIRYNENFKFEDNGIWGMSLLAIDDLLSKKNFSLIAVESSGTNAFFINNKFKSKFEILSPLKSYRSVGRFYNLEKKQEIFENVRKNYNELIEL